MAAPRTQYGCQQCGYQAPRWLGRCPDCGAWGSLVEETRPRSRPAAGRPGPGKGGAARPVPITAVPTGDHDRLPTDIGEFDRVLGGGLTVGSVILIGGEPGIGKSTLLVQLAGRLAEGGRAVLYVSGEESLAQASARGRRVGAESPRLHLLAETSLEAILGQVEANRPEILVLDSIQTTAAEGYESAPGTIGQVREVATRLMHLAKQEGVTVLLIGHVTKDGTLAGPKALEHLVDTVLYFEGDGRGAYRILRATKNRFGPTDEIGVFRMEASGLAEVPNPSRLFLADAAAGRPGSAVVAIMEGTRPLLVEVQALVGPMGIGTPRRAVNGLDPQRAAMLLAVAEKRLGLALGGCDVYLNVAGGIRVGEAAADLGVLAAALSSYRDRPMEAGLLCFGEVGLAGEVRAVVHADRRLHEAARLGFTRALVPAGNAKAGPEGLALHPLRDVEGLAAALAAAPPW